MIRCLKHILLIFACVLLFPLENHANVSRFQIHAPKYVIGDQWVPVEIGISSKEDKTDSTFNSTLSLVCNDSIIRLQFSQGIASFSFLIRESSYLKFELPDGGIQVIRIRRISPAVSIIPPLLAILLAIILREVILSLLIGVLSGIVLVLGFYDPLNWIKAPLRFIDTYLPGVFKDDSHMAIILFSLIIGAMVNVVIQGGGMLHLVRKISIRVKSRRGLMTSTWIMGILVFFDDYANSLIVGKSMRPLFDRFRISREKLAYLVDSTAAPVASIALITTWIGAQLNYIDDASAVLNLKENAYEIFLNSLGYAFYPLLTLFFIITMISLKRDYGPMWKAEKSALNKEDGVLGKLRENIFSDKEEMSINTRAHYLDALVPVFMLILGAFASLLYLGYDSSIWENENEGFFVKLMQTIAKANSMVALLWASFFSLTLAVLLNVFRKNLKLRKSMEAASDGIKTMMTAIIILILAWVLQSITHELKTSDFLIDCIGEGIPITYLSSIVFILAALVAFSTGSSWGTMAVLYPMVLPVTYQTCMLQGLEYQESMMFFHQVVAAVLGGSVFGDHCSPISDTTILSSMASSCDHISHVRTQMPYALTVGLITVIFGYWLVSLQLFHPFFAFLICASIIFVILRFFGKPLESGKENVISES
jgi:Na+/H+ antiporter NhaC